jgi:serine/threonine protein kinase
VKIKAHTTMPGELQGFVGTQAYMAPEVSLLIRIHMFLGLLDPDPLVRGMDPDPDPSVINPASTENFFFRIFV